MIILNVNNEEKYSFDKEELEGKLLEATFKILEDADAQPMIKQTIKSSVGMLFGLMGIHKPKELKDMDNLEFAIRFVTSQVLEQLENKGEISITASKLEKEKEEV